MVVAVTALFFIIWFIEWRKTKKQIQMAYSKTRLSTAVAFIAFLLIGCNPKAEKINLGKDQCAECKMTIADPKFGAEIVTKKGKVYKFDDTHCIAVFFGAPRRGAQQYSSNIICSV